MTSKAHELDEPFTVGVDVGGTKVVAGVVDRNGRVIERTRNRTPERTQPPEVVEELIVELVWCLRSEYDVSAVGVGAAGFVRRDGVVAFAPHLPWRGEPLAETLSARLGLPVAVDNDANVTALAEFRKGAASGHEDFICLTLGTGIGGALVLDGKVRRGGHGYAGEFGHMPVDPNGRACPCGQRGCWEQYCSGTALAVAARSLEGAPRDVDGPAVMRAAVRGQPWAVSAFEQIGAWLGHGLAGVCAGVDPELVIVGGGLAEAGELLMTPARAVLEQRLVGAGHRPVPGVRVAELGPDAGLVGAAILARERFG